jgi:hypothetical protein
VTPRSAVETSLRWLPAAVLAALALLRALSTPLVSPDSAYYIDTARQLAEGHGPVTYVLHLAMPEVPAPAGFWPTLYPRLMGWIVAAGVPAERAPGVLNGAALVALCLVLVRIARRCVPPALAWPLALLAVAHPFYVYVLHYAWSEALFMVFVYAGLAVLCDLQRATAVPLSRCAAAGALAGAAFATRYAGIFFLGYALAVLGVVAIRARWRALDVARGVGATVAAFVPMAAPAVLSNLRVYGSSFGLPRVPASAPARAALARAHELVVTSGEMWLHALAVLAVAALLVRRASTPSGPGRPPRDGAAWLFGGWVVFYTCALFVSVLPYVRSDRLEARFLAPVAPAAVVTVMLGLARRRTRVHRATAVVACAVALAVFAYTWDRERPRGDAPDPLADWARSHREDDGVYVGTELWLLRGRAGVVVLTDGYPEMPSLQPRTLRDFLGHQGVRFRTAHLVFGAGGAMTPASAPAYARALGDVGFVPQHTDRLADGSLVVTLHR